MKPKYQVIIEDIKSKILSGDYNVGEQIPTESALQSLYEVSRQTVRKAILELSNEGFLRSEKVLARMSATNIAQRPAGVPIRRRSV